MGDIDSLKEEVARLRSENAALSSERSDFQKRFVRLQDESKRRKNTEKELSQLRELVSSMATEVSRLKTREAERDPAAPDGRSPSTPALEPPPESDAAVSPFPYAPALRTGARAASPERNDAVVELDQAEALLTSTLAHIRREKELRDRDTSAADAALADAPPLSERATPRTPRRSATPRSVRSSATSRAKTPRQGLTDKQMHKIVQYHTLEGQTAVAASNHTWASSLRGRAKSPHPSEIHAKQQRFRDRAAPAFPEEFFASQDPAPAEPARALAAGQGRQPAPASPPVEPAGLLQRHVDGQQPEANPTPRSNTIATRGSSDAAFGPEKLPLHKIAALLEDALISQFGSLASAEFAMAAALGVPQPQGRAKFGVTQIEQLCEILSLPLTSRDIRRLFHAMDSDRVGQVDFLDINRVADTRPEEQRGDDVTSPDAQNKPKSRDGPVSARQKRDQTPPASTPLSIGGKLLDVVCHQQFVRSLRAGSPPGVRARLRRPSRSESFGEAHVAAVRNGLAAGVRTPTSPRSPSRSPARSTHLARAQSSSAVSGAAETPMPKTMHVLGLPSRARATPVALSNQSSLGNLPHSPGIVLSSPALRSVTPTRAPRLLAPARSPHFGASPLSPSPVSLFSPAASSGYM